MKLTAVQSGRGVVSILIAWAILFCSPASVCAEGVQSSAQDKDPHAALRRTQVPCPPILDPAICAQPLDTCEKWQACAGMCAAAACCQDDCGSCPSCQSYVPCLDLGESPCVGPPGGGGGNSTCSVFTVDYYEGFNLNFKIGKAEAKSIMPDRQFTPIKMNLVKGRHERGRGHYVLSWYAAKIAVDFAGTGARIGRADLFTYSLDPSGELSLIILAAILEVPEGIPVGSPAFMAYQQAVESFSLDSRTGKTAYPHYYAETFNIDENGFEVDIIGGERIKVTNQCDGSRKKKRHNRYSPTPRITSFSQKFVLANSQAYRSPIDKNVNYFNKDFIAAEVLDLPRRCLAVDNLEYLQTFNPDRAKLLSGQAYGSSDEAITWQYEDVTSSEGTPYFTLDETIERTEFKRNAFSAIWAQRGVDVSSGNGEMLLKAKNQNMFYVNWELSDQGVEELSADLMLEQRGFSLVPIKVLEDDDARYLLTLNAYDTELVGVPDGSAAAVRFEFSVYVTTANDPRPRFMVIEALSSADTFDPVNGPVPASDILFSVIDGYITTEIRGDSSWQAKFTLRTYEDDAEADEDWITATDIVFWTNGVADKVFYDSMLAAQSPILAKTQTISEIPKWSDYLVNYSTPVHAFLYEDPMDFVITPWYNLKDESLPLEDEQRQGLQQLKNFIYGGLANLTSTLVGAGLQEPLVDLVAYGEYPKHLRLFLNFEIPEQNVEEFQKVIDLPDRYRLSKTRMAAGVTGPWDADERIGKDTVHEMPRYFLTFEVFEQELFYPMSLFSTARWTVYVKDTIDGSGPYLHEFYVESSSEGLDVEQFLKPAAEIFDFTTVDDMVKVHIKGQDVEAKLEVPLITSEERTKLPLADDYVFAHDRVLWRKGIYDKVFYDGSLRSARFIPVTKSDGNVQVKQSSPWSHLVKPAPFQVFFFDSDTTFVSNPWFNIEEIPEEL